MSKLEKKAELNAAAGNQAAAYTHINYAYKDMVDRNQLLNAFVAGFLAGADHKEKEWVGNNSSHTK